MEFPVTEQHRLHTIYFYSCIHALYKHMHDKRDQFHPCWRCHVARIHHISWPALTSSHSQQSYQHHHSNHSQIQTQCLCILEMTVTKHLKHELNWSSDQQETWGLDAESMVLWLVHALWCKPETSSMSVRWFRHCQFFGKYIGYECMSTIILK